MRRKSSEMWVNCAFRALTNGPRVGHGGLETIIDTNVAAVGQFNPVLFETDALRVRCANRGDEDVGAVEISVTGRRAARART